MADYQIITDATADLSPDLAISLGVVSVPMEINLDEEYYTYVPGGGDIGLDTFYSRMLNGSIARTSQINPQVYTNVFEKYLAQGKDIVYICLSSGVSATVQGALLSADQLKEIYPGRKIFVIDSLCISLGEALIITAAVEKQKNGLNADELAAWLNENKLRVCHWFTVDDLEYLKRGGRLSAVQAAIGTTLNLKPVLHVDDTGHLINVKKVRSRKKALAAMVEEMTQTYLADCSNEVFIGHGACPADAQQLADLVKNVYADIDIRIFDIGPVIGAHAGPGVLALFFWGKIR